MTTFSNTTEKEIKAFSRREWHGFDVEHYGKTVDWNNKSFLWKAIQDGKTVGSASGKHESGIIYIFDIIVARSHQRKGIGRSFMKRIEIFGKKLGAHKIQLYTGVGWSANKFYEALGFTIIATLPDHHFHHDFVIYQKYI